MKWFSLVLLSLLIVSCTSYSEEDLARFDQTIREYLDSTNVTMDKTEDGLYYNIIDEGEGDEYIRFNDQVVFAYKGYHLNGNSFQVVHENDPLTFKVGQLIIGWQDALMMLKKGGKIEIIIPPQLAYGEKQTDLIPQHSILRYELSVLDVK